jgi:16S rRNA (guanine966-N2)-methyltransferase
MRIISGSLRGRKLRAVPDQGVRPTSDRVREALFSRLGPLQGEQVLDLYAGTGALGFEALSRGAASVVFVEWAAAPFAVLQGNVSDLGVEESTEIYRAKAEVALRRLSAAQRRFDLVFIDPPYASDEAESSLLALVEGSLLSPQAQVVVESSKHHLPAPVPGLSMLDERSYGDTVITRWRPEEAIQDMV